MLEVIDIHKQYATKPALDGVSLSIAQGEVVALLGPSGCGKSTLLRTIAGLISLDDGQVIWGGVDLGGKQPHERGFGLMFQDYALFPHMNVFENVAFGLKMLNWGKDEQEKRVTEVLQLVSLPDFGNRTVHTLSGGEQQRVALARALAPQPKLLMLDEPLGALDRALRERLLQDLRRILRETGQTALYVTHDQEEAYALADRVVVLNAGQVAQSGTPQAIYQHPANAFVARFVGLHNVLTGEVISKGDVYKAETEIGIFPIANPKGLSGNVDLLFRPDQARLGAGTIQLNGRVTEVFFRGGIVQVFIEVKGVSLRFDFSADTTLPAVGEKIEIGLEEVYLLA